MEEYKYIAIPISPRITLSLSSKSQLVDATTYKKLIGILLYLTISRINITFIVNLMARFMQKTYIEHLNDVKKILRYVAGRKDLALKYCKLTSFVLLELLDYDYGADRDDMKSTSMCVFNINLGAIS